MSNSHDIIKGPCLTEKSARAQESFGKVVFKVNPKANKIEIKQTIEKKFNVKVASVRTAKVKGKMKRVGRHAGYASDWKKATVTLAEGKINFLEDL
ncbi:MAG: 50S ribosomal protein L23 [Deltaproteobacteria bacterium RIFOXYD12_FULL_57_12]|nr:MAG: 50S ribosomal protein L23 [Deltaproteobacteria bacterium RIFOXYD12_FULL_57_12]